MHTDERDIHILEERAWGMTHSDPMLLHFNPTPLHIHSSASCEVVKLVFVECFWKDEGVEERRRQKSSVSEALVVKEGSQGKRNRELDIISIYICSLCRRVFKAVVQTRVRHEHYAT